MKLSSPRWDNTNGDLDGLLYFAQRLDEMLFNFSIDLYKAPVLNTHSLLVEYISIYNNTEISRLPSIFGYTSLLCAEHTAENGDGLEQAETERHSPYRTDHTRLCAAPAIG